MIRQQIKAENNAYQQKINMLSKIEKNDQILMVKIRNNINTQRSVHGQQ